MSSVISQLWMRDDRNLLIMPGTVPLDQASVSSELSRYLDDGWDPIIRLQAGSLKVAELMKTNEVNFNNEVLAQYL